MKPTLTPAERARLRPSVDVSALERFLAEIPDDVRPGVQTAVVLHFSRNVTMADIRDFLNAMGSDDAADAVDRAIATKAPEKPPPVADGPEAPRNELFTMEAPKSPRLRELWNAIEPGQSLPG
jgi:hypothetical protein